MLPEQTVVPPVTVPPTEIGSTITVVSDEFSAAQTPLWTVALNLVVWASGLERSVGEVLEKSVQVSNGETELCHLTIVPV